MPRKFWFTFKYTVPNGEALCQFSAEMPGLPAEEDIKALQQIVRDRFNLPPTKEIILINSQELRL